MAISHNYRTINIVIGIIIIIIISVVFLSQSLLQIKALFSYLAFTVYGMKQKTCKMYEQKKRTKMKQKTTNQHKLQW